MSKAQALEPDVPTDQALGLGGGSRSPPWDLVADGLAELVGARHASI